MNRRNLLKLGLLTVLAPWSGLAKTNHLRTLHVRKGQTLQLQPGHYYRKIVVDGGTVLLGPGSGQIEDLLIKTGVVAFEAHTITLV